MNHRTGWPAGGGILLHKRSPEVASIIDGVPLGLSVSSFPDFFISEDQGRNCDFDLQTPACPSSNHNPSTERTMTRLGELELKDAAREAAGNWQDFNCFAWFRKSELKKPEDWAIIYTHNRDSGLLDKSNAAVIEAAMKPFTEGDDSDVVLESHNHWLVGHVDGFSIRVFKRGRITKAFKTYHELAERMADYPILDESDYSEREYEAAYENLDLAAWRLKLDFNLPSDWQSSVFDWLWQNRANALENVDDQGGFPKEDDLETAFSSLGYERAA
jgi:hypothetical protein